MPGQLIISLDFELLWGVCDHADRASYGTNIMGAREAIPRILELFDTHSIAATWATVGFAMCGSRDELMESLPPRDLWPSYDAGRLSSYAYLDDVGRDERQDPYFFGASLVERIQQTPHQEIGTHTLSHYYCLEPGQKLTQFEADLEAAIILAKRRKINFQSIFFYVINMLHRIWISARDLELRRFAGHQHRKYTALLQARIKPCCDVQRAWSMRIRECSGIRRFQWIGGIARMCPQAISCALAAVSSGLPILSIAK